MGIFERTVGKGILRAASGALSEVATAAKRAGSGIPGTGGFCTKCGKLLTPGAAFCSSCGAKAAPAAEPVKDSRTAPPGFGYERNDIRQLMPKVLSEVFSGYDIRRGASAAELGFASALPARSYDYALLSGGRTRAVILLTDHNRDNNAAFKNAKAAAISAGVPFMNFYTHMQNERAYVENRIRENLR